MTTQTPDDLSPWNLDEQSEDGELHKASIDGSHVEQTTHESFQHDALPSRNKVTYMSTQPAARLPASCITSTSDLMMVGSGKISHLLVTGMTLIVTEGHSDPTRGPSEQLFLPGNDERWFFSNGTCPVLFAAYNPSVIVHRPHWLTDDTIGAVRNAIGPLEICTVNQTVAIDCRGNLASAYKLIKVEREDNIAAQLLTDTCCGISTISVMLWVRPRWCYSQRVEDDILRICLERKLHYYIDDSDDKAVMF